MLAFAKRSLKKVSFFRPKKQIVQKAPQMMPPNESVPPYTHLQNSLPGIGQDTAIIGAKNGHSGGRFGDNSPHGSNATQIITSPDNLVTANDSYDKIAIGGKEPSYIFLITG